MSLKLLMTRLIAVKPTITRKRDGNQKEKQKRRWQPKVIIKQT